MKETAKNFLDKYSSILWIAGFVLLLGLYFARWFTPEMGENVMIDEGLNCLLGLFAGIYFLAVFVVAIIKKEFATATLKTKFKRVLAGIVGVAFLAFSTYSVYKVVSDLSNGTEVIKLTNIEFYETRRIKGRTTYSIEGINSETGEFGTYEISYDACEQYVGEDSVFLEYYPKTQRVVDCFK